MIEPSPILQTSFLQPEPLTGRFLANEPPKPAAFIHEKPPERGVRNVRHECALRKPADAPVSHSGNSPTAALATLWPDWHAAVGVPPVSQQTYLTQIE